MAGVRATLLLWASLVGCAPPAPPGPVATVPAVVATRDMVVGHLVAPEDLKVTQLPAALVGAGAYTEPEPVYGKLVAERILAGEVLRSERLVDPTEQAELSVLVPEGKVAVTLPIGAMSVRRRLEAGDLADLVVFADDGTADKLTERTEILAMHESGNTTYVTVAVTMKEAEKLDFGARKGVELVRAESPEP